MTKSNVLQSTELLNKIYKVEKQEQSSSFYWDQDNEVETTI